MGVGHQREEWCAVRRVYLPSRRKGACLVAIGSSHECAAQYCARICTPRLSRPASAELRISDIAPEPHSALRVLERWRFGNYDTNKAGSNIKVDPTAEHIRNEAQGRNHGRQVGYAQAGSRRPA